MKILTLLIITIISVSCISKKREQRNVKNITDKFEEDLEVYITFLPKLITEEIVRNHFLEEEICIVLEDTTGVSKFDKELIEHFKPIDPMGKDRSMSFKNLQKKIFRNKNISLLSIFQKQKYNVTNRIEECPLNTHKVYFNVSRVGFNNKQDHGAFFYAWVCGGLCGNGIIVFIKKKGKDWVIDDKIIVWMA